MSKKILLYIICHCFTMICIAQKVALKTNLAYWATSTLNIGGEVKLNNKTTLDLTVGYNPFTWSDNQKWKHWLVMPEVRYYLCESFNGHFFGLHTGYSEYNIGGVPLFYNKDTKDYRYEGWGIGAGLSYGYQWILGNRWNLEATIGYGVVYTKYDKYIQNRCGAHLGGFDNLFLAPTKLGISFIYFIR